MKYEIVCLAVLAALAGMAERQPFERYRSVVDRQMFGPPPEGFDPTKRPSEVASSRDAKQQQQELTKEQEKLKSSIRFSMINVTPAGETAVGFTDSSDAKNPKNYYLRVGESRDGWTVREADPVASSMTIMKGEVEVSLTIGGDSGKGAGKTAAASAAPAPTGGSSLGSLRARRLQRQNERLAQSQAQQAKMDEMLKAMKDREAADARRREEEKAEREAERAEQKAQLLRLQDELKKQREKAEAEKAKAGESNSEEGTEGNE